MSTWWSRHVWPFHWTVNVHTFIHAKLWTKKPILTPGGRNAKALICKIHLIYVHHKGSVKGLLHIVWKVLDVFSFYISANKSHGHLELPLRINGNVTHAIMIVWTWHIHLCDMPLMLEIGEKCSNKYWFHFILCMMQEHSIILCQKCTKKEFSCY